MTLRRSSRPARCLGFALADKTASAVIIQLKRDLAAAFRRPKLAIELARNSNRIAVAEAKDLLNRELVKYEGLPPSDTLPCSLADGCDGIGLSGLAGFRRGALKMTPLTIARAVIGQSSSSEGHGRRSRL